MGHYGDTRKDEEIQKDSSLKGIGIVLTNIIHKNKDQNEE
jgi:hypothetical protein